MMHDEEVIDICIDQINEAISTRINAVSLTEANAIMAGVAQFVSATVAGLREDMKRKEAG